MASMARLGVAVLCGLALWSAGRTEAWVFVLIAAYGLWSVLNLWREITGRGGTSAPLYYLASALVVVAMVRGTDNGVILSPLLLQPILVGSLVNGIATGAAIGGVAALALVLDVDPPGIDTDFVVAAIGVLVVAPATALLARPMAALRRRTELALEFARELDPRRGVQTIGLAIADRMRHAMQANRVLILHRDAERNTLLISDHEEGSYVASRALSERLSGLLAPLPTTAIEMDASPAGDGKLTLDDPAVDPGTVRSIASEVAQLIEATHLQLVPDALKQPKAAWIMVAHGPARALGARPWPLRPLVALAGDVRPMLQLATYADSLQEEIAAHERVRIGRDLHDSALQPYLGLKFAIEGLVLQSSPGDPLHAQVRELQRLCDVELGELRETVSALRVGEIRGESTLIPALRRQSTRFASLFGIEVQLDVPNEVVTSRSLSAAILHMVNEALSNVRRHTIAKSVWVSLKAEPGMLLLIVRDNAGRLGGQPAPAFEPRSLTERACELGGSLEQGRHDGIDTEIRITVPR